MGSTTFLHSTRFVPTSLSLAYCIFTWRLFCHTFGSNFLFSHCGPLLRKILLAHDLTTLLGGFLAHRFPKYLCLLFCFVLLWSSEFVDGCPLLSPNFRPETPFSWAVFFKIGLLVHNCFGPILNFFQLGLTLVWVCISEMGWHFFKKPFVGRYKPILGSVFKPNMRLACIDPPSSLDPADFLGGEI